MQTNQDKAPTASASVDAKQYTVDGRTYTREQALRLIWRHTHRDFKGKSAQGVRTILVYEQGTTLVEFDKLSDEHIMDKLPYCAHKDATDKAKRGSKGAK